ncbi:MAG: sigma-70 family RNA polymerase sigma factor [Alphaproteobacteria bacterium]|nr:sigma-70 family RNA polymerase sigma factor [Alphaproteobacteria bacterium]
MGQAAGAISRWRTPRSAAGAWRVSAPEASSADDVHSKCIIAIARDRDRDGFAALFSHFAPRVKAYLMRTGSAPSLAEELAQETMLSVWRKAELFDPARASAATWVFTIARNLRIDAARRVRDPASLAGEIEPEAPEEPFAAVARRQSQALIREALKQLPAEQREVLALSFFEDRPHSEIATKLKIPLGTVKSRVRLAVSKLRELVEGRT